MATKDELLGSKLQGFSLQFPRWGWRKAHWYLSREGTVVNRKKIQRLWREEGLKGLYKSKKKRRRGKGEIKLKAMQTNHVWAADFQTDETSGGGQLRFFNVVDEYTKENLLQYVVGHSYSLSPLIRRLQSDNTVTSQGGVDGLFETSWTHGKRGT